jgi:hypothetical protein
MIATAAGSALLVLIESARNRRPLRPMIQAVSFRPNRTWSRLLISRFRSGVRIVWPPYCATGMKTPTGVPATRMTTGSRAPLVRKRTCAEGKVRRKKSM